jgi:glycosyltransferase involved in cell wall biosynthesis
MTPERQPKIAWISNFPVEWLPDAPAFVRDLPRTHPATWQRVLFDELMRRDERQKECGVQSAECRVKDGAGGAAQDERGALSPPDTRHPSPVTLHVLLVRRHFPRSLSFDLNGATFHCLKLPPGMRTFSLFWWETFLIRRCLSRINPDLVHAWGTERGTALVASRLKYPYLVTMQGLLEWYSQRVRLSRYQRLEARLERPSLRRASVLTTESTFAVNWLRERYPHLDILQAEHAPNWLFHRLERRPETKPLRFLFVAPLTHIKGADLLVRGLDQLCNELDFRLTIVGPHQPGFLPLLKTVTSTEIWDRVSLRQNLSQPEVADELARATMVLFPTRVDTSPNAVKEAVVAGVPVIASAIGGITDYVRPGLNGFTCEPGDLGAFIQSTRSAVVHPLFSKGRVDPAVLPQLRDYLSPSRMRERFLEAYRRVLERARGRNEKLDLTGASRASGV